MFLRRFSASLLLPVVVLLLLGILVYQQQTIGGLSDSLGELSRSRSLLSDPSTQTQHIPSLQSMSGPMDCLTWLPLPHSSSKPPVKVNKKPSLNIGTESDVDRAESFKQIWEDNAWGKETKSGPGSLIQNTVNMRKVLASVTDRIKLELNKPIITLLDSSCGDMAWMPTFLQNRTDVVFTGYDIVPNNVNSHKQKFAGKPWTFEVHDIVSDKIPTQDIILSRHTLQHLKTGDIQKILANFLSSGSNFLLTTNFPKVRSNTELDSHRQYRFRPVNLLLHPYYLPSPVCNHEDIPGENLDITLWDLRTIREQLKSEEKV